MPGGAETSSCLLIRKYRDKFAHKENLMVALNAALGDNRNLL